MTDKNITRLEEQIEAIDPLKIAIEPGTDASVGVKLMGYKDADGNARRLLVKGENVPTKSVFPVTDNTYNLGGSSNAYSDAFFKDENGAIFTARELATTINGVFVSEDVPILDGIKQWILVLIYYWNYLLWSEDFEQASWIKTGATFNTSTGILSPAPSGVNYMGLICANGTGINRVKVVGASIDIIGKTTFAIWCRPGALDHIILSKQGSGDSAVRFDLTNKTSTIQQPTPDNYQISDLGNGDCLVCLELTTTAKDGNFIIYASDGSGYGSTGDGTTTSLYVMGAIVRPGTIADNFPYLKTTTVPVSAPAYVHEENVENVTTVDAATYTVLATDRTLLIDYSATGTCAILIPTAEITISGRELTIIDSGGLSGTNNITISTEDSETINGAATKVISTNYGRADLSSNGSNLFG